MDTGGRTLLSLDRGLSRMLDATSAVRDHPGVTAAWEVPLGMLLTMLANHEVNGHGGRAEEFNLHPRYQFKLDLSASTGILRDPQSNLQVGCLALGGIEADMVTALRLQRDLFRPSGAEASTVPALLFAKLDLSLYVARAPWQDSSRFRDEYAKGNDIVLWLVSRQAMRNGADPGALWNRTLTIDTSDPMLERNLRDARATALWNLLDPSLAGSVWLYITHHLGRGNTRIEPPSLKLGDGYTLMLGTHGTLGPTEVSRYVDLYLRTPIGLAYGYVRDLDSSMDRTHGYGGGLHEVALGPSIHLSVTADQWRNPNALEYTSRPSSSWNVSTEIEAMFGTRAPRHLAFGLSVFVGRKSQGFLPGRPVDGGNYLGGGLLVSF